MNKEIKISYFIVLFLAVCYLGYALFSQHNVSSNHALHTQTQRIEPTEVTALSDGWIEYTLNLENDSCAISRTLQFFSSHQAVEVYSEDELIYALEPVPSLYGHTTGTGINMVTIPAHATLVKVAVKSVFESTGNKQYDFFYGDTISMYREIMIDSILNVFMSILIIVLGLFLILYWVIAHKKMRQSPSIAFFGLFSFMIGLWSINETDFMMLLLTNRTVMSVFGYMLLMLLAVPFMQFIYYSFEKPHRNLCYALCVLSIFETIVLTMLHIADIWEFKESVWLIHLMMILGILYMFLALIERIRTNGLDRKVRVNLIAAVLLGISIVADFVAYYMGLQQTDVLGKIGILAYIILLGAESTSDAFAKIQEGKKAEFYKNLAVTDVMTGLLNRSAFEEWEENCSDFTNTMLVTFDLNNLKTCNDTLGHAAGDTYIIAAAKMIQHVFGSVAKCYRIGGDEFCAVVRNGNKIKIEKYLAKLIQKQEEYNRASDEVKIHIAVGYALHDETSESIEQTRSNADSYMYRNKKQIKENGEQ